MKPIAILVTLVCVCVSQEVHHFEWKHPSGRTYAIVLEGRISMNVAGFGEAEKDIQTEFEASVALEGKLARTLKPPKQTSQYSLEVTSLKVTTGAVTFKYPCKDEDMPDADGITLKSVRALFDSLKELQAVEIATDGTIQFPNKALQMSRLAEQVLYFVPMPSTGVQVSESFRTRIAFPRLQFPGAKGMEAKVTEVLESVTGDEAKLSVKSDDDAVAISILFDCEKGYVKEQTGSRLQSVKYSATFPDGERSDISISLKVSDWHIKLKIEK